MELKIEKIKARLEKIEAELEKCRTSSFLDGWQTSKHVKKARKWDYYASEKMRLLKILDEMGAL